jgi:DedD protein
MMERALKERIIGAVVLVVFVVLVVPIFLDGPPGEEEIVTERVLLPGQDETRTQTVVLDRDRTEPVPAGTSNETPAEPAEQPAAAEPEASETEASEPAADEPEVDGPEVSEPVVRREEPAPAPTQPVSSTTGMWAVQLGSFSNKANAEKLAADLRKQGYAAFLSQLDTDSGTLHRVRIGPQKDRDAAEAMAARLLKVDIKGQVVPHP